MRRNPMKLLQAMLGKTPEALNAVDVVRAARELILSVIDSVMLRVTDIDQTIVTTPAITMDDCLKSNAPANNGLQRGFRAVRRNLRVDFAVTLQETEDGRLARGSATAFTSNTARAEVTFINFDLAGKWRRTLTFFSNALTNLEKDQGDGFTSDTSQLCDIGGREIHRKVAQKLAEFLFGNSGTRIIAVSSFHSSSLALL